MTALAQIIAVIATECNTNKIQKITVIADEQDTEDNSVATANKIQKITVIAVGLLQLLPLSHHHQRLRHLHLTLLPRRLLFTTSAANTTS